MIKTIAGEEGKQEIAEEAFRTTRRTMFLLLGYCLFCWIALAGPDLELLGTAQDNRSISEKASISMEGLRKLGEATVKLPFANVEINLPSFLIVGALITLAIWIYLQIFFGVVEVFNRKRHKNISTPFLFNMNGFFPRLLSHFLLYWMGPITIFLFAIKATPRFEVNILMPLAFSTTIAANWLVIIRNKVPRPIALSLSLWAFMFILIIITPFILYSGYKNGYPRDANFSRADLSSKDLRPFYFKGANLNNSDLSHANLFKVNLSAADLSRANLTDANLIWSNLDDAVLERANLVRADLRGASISRAILFRTNLVNADLKYANLYWSDLYKADLTGANLAKASFFKAVLLKADLTDADLTDADLTDADLTDAKVNPNQLKKACVREFNMQPELPNGLEFTNLKLGLCPSK